ncbi:sugar phosphate isomerase/epimerase family protein, partial [Thermodesulfobacteriota bacterium]
CLIDMVEDLLSAGLNCIELSASPPVNEDEIEYLSKIEAQFSIHNYFPPPTSPFVLNLASSTDKYLADSLNMARYAIGLTAKLGSSFYGVHSGLRSDVEPTSLGGLLVYGAIVPYDKSYERFVKSLQILCDYANAQNIAIGVEPNVITNALLTDGRNELLLICEPWEISALLRDVSRDNLGILLDMGHLSVASATLGFSRGGFIDLVAPDTVAIHLHDNNGLSDTHQPVQPGSWVFDVLCRPEFCKLPVIVEAKFDNVTNLCRHVDWLRKELGHE